MIYIERKQLTMKQINVSPHIPPIRLPYLKDLIPTMLMLLASRGVVMGMSPFAVAFFGAVYDKKIGYLGVIASLIGIATSSGIAQVPKYLIALVACFLFCKFGKKRSIAVDSVAVGVSQMLGGGVMLLAGFKGVFDIFLLATEAITSALMYIIFTKAKSVTEDFHHRKAMSGEEYVSVAITIGDRKSVV